MNVMMLSVVFEKFIWLNECLGCGRKFKSDDLRYAIYPSSRLDYPYCEICVMLKKLKDSK